MAAAAGEGHRMRGGKAWSGVEEEGRGAGTGTVGLLWVRGLGPTRQGRKERHSPRGGAGRSQRSAASGPPGWAVDFHRALAPARRSKARVKPGAGGGGKDPTSGCLGTHCCRGTNPPPPDRATGERLAQCPQGGWERCPWAHPSPLATCHTDPRGQQRAVVLQSGCRRGVSGAQLVQLVPQQVLLGLQLVPCPLGQPEQVLGFVQSLALPQQGDAAGGGNRVGGREQREPGRVCTTPRGLVFPLPASPQLWGQTG